MNENNTEVVAWLYTSKLGGRQVSLLSPPPDLKDQYQPLYTDPPQANRFNPDWDAIPVMVEEQQRMAKRIEELETQLGEAMWGYGEWRRKAEALEQEKQEPIAFVRGWDLRRGDLVLDVFCAKTGMSFERDQPLYTAPPQREWVGLTDEELHALHFELKVQTMGGINTLGMYRILEKVLREKNG